MKGQDKAAANKSERAHLTIMVRAAVANKPSIFKECMSKVLDMKGSKLIKEEKSRLANICFSDASTPRGQVGLKEDEDANELMYNKLYIVDAALYQREQPHMPEWMQNASPDGSYIEPVKEKDAVDLSSKFHSVEFTTEA